MPTKEALQRVKKWLKKQVVPSEWSPETKKQAKEMAEAAMMVMPALKVGKIGKIIKPGILPKYQKYYQRITKEIPKIIKGTEKIDEGEIVRRLKARGLPVMLETLEYPLRYLTKTGILGKTKEITRPLKGLGPWFKKEVIKSAEYFLKK